jgi:hypothetical protein
VLVDSKNPLCSETVSKCWNYIQRRRQI